MKKIMIFTALLMVTISMAGQNVVHQSKAERKAERKKAREKIEREMTINTEKALTSGNFVLKADQIRDRRGNMMMVNSSINFVAVRGKDAFVQFGSESGMGYNGVGGLTIRGEVLKYSLDRNKKTGVYNIELTTSGTFGALTISVHSNMRGDNAEATVRSNWGGMMSFSGEITPVEGAHIFKGSEIY